MTKCVEQQGIQNVITVCVHTFYQGHRESALTFAGSVTLPLDYQLYQLNCIQARSFKNYRIFFFFQRICSKPSIAVGGFLFMCGLLIFAPSSSQLLRLVFEQLNINSNSPPFGNYKLLSDFKSTAFICTNKEQNVMIHSLLSSFFLDTFWSISRSLYAHMAISKHAVEQNTLQKHTFIEQTDFNGIFIETNPLHIFI